MARASTMALESDLRALIAKYAGRISTAEAIGVLMLQVHEIATSTDNRDEDEE